MSSTSRIESLPTSAEVIYTFHSCSDIIQQTAPPHEPEWGLQTQTRACTCEVCQVSLGFFISSMDKTYLDHELGDDAVERAALIAETLLVLQARL
jgi:hypothetical protein